MSDIYLTREQVRTIDRLAVSRYHMTGPVLMENAGGNAARIILREYPTAQAFAIVAGPGNNGGDGCVIARHLHNAGRYVRLLMTGQPDRMTNDTTLNFRIVQSMGIEHVVSPDPDDHSAFLHDTPRDALLVDALLGTGFRGQVRPPTDGLISRINDHAADVVAIDVPSGLDVDTGAPSNATIRASLTVTFVARKTGFAAPSAKPYLGHVFVADIGAPRELIDQVRALAG